MHTGFSQRSWLSARGRDLYKGNGRVRHETHFLEQGPFQAISYTSFQGTEVDPLKTDQGIYDVGGEYHLDVSIFRNDKMFPDWKNCETLSIKDLGINILEGKSRGHQEDARLESVREFVKHVSGKRIKPQSELSDHRNAVAVTSGIYQANANSFAGLPPYVKIKL